MQVYSGKLSEQYSIRIFNTISSIDKNSWNSIQLSIPFFQKHTFLSLIEKIQDSIEFRYIIFYQNELPLAAVYMQLLDFSYKNLVNYSAEDTKNNYAFVKKYIAKKNTKLLNVGNVFFTGDRGIIASDDLIVINNLPAVFNIVKKTFLSKKPSAYLIANIYLQDQKKCIDFCNKAFHSFNTEPDLFLKIKDDWNTFEDYMNALTSKYRVRAKKVLSASSELEQRIFSLEELKNNKAQFQQLYNNVVNHVAFNMASLNIDFFENAKAIYGENCTILGYFLQGKMVSFVCLFHVEPRVLHIHYIGLDYEVNTTVKLYNRMLLDFVRFAIEHKVQTVHFGRTATEIKTTIGAEPKQLQAYLKMNNPVFNAALPTFLNRIKAPEFIIRNPFR